VGNRMMGRAVVANAKKTFGPMPETIPGELRAFGPAAVGPGSGPQPSISPAENQGADGGALGPQR
jgi:hypothetical protein